MPSTGSSDNHGFTPINSSGTTIDRLKSKDEHVASALKDITNTSLLPPARPDFLIDRLNLAGGTGTRIAFLPAFRKSPRQDETQQEKPEKRKRDVPKKIGHAKRSKIKSPTDGSASKPDTISGEHLSQDVDLEDDIDDDMLAGSTCHFYDAEDPEEERQRNALIDDMAALDELEHRHSAPPSSSTVENDHADVADRFLDDNTLAAFAEDFDIDCDIEDDTLASLVAGGALTKEHGDDSKLVSYYAESDYDYELDDETLASLPAYGSFIDDLDEDTLMELTSVNLDFEEETSGIPPYTIRASAQLPEIITPLAAEASTTAHPQPSPEAPSIINTPVSLTPPPEPTRDRSPISGLSAKPRLSVHFRTGAALNVGCAAARSDPTPAIISPTASSSIPPPPVPHKPSIILELYARIVEAVETDSAIEIVLTDLWTNETGPYIRAVYPRERWKGQKLWEEEARMLLTTSDMGSDVDVGIAEMTAMRVLGFMKRRLTMPRKGGEDKEIVKEGEMMRKVTSKWEMEIMSIWECDWDDVEHVRGVIQA